LQREDAGVSVGAVPQRGDHSPSLAPEGLAWRLWRSVFPHPVLPRSERERRKTILEFFVLHLRPVRVRRSTLRYTHTFGLGGSSLTLIALMVGTGALLMLAYEPTPDRAYLSVVALERDTLFGGLVRNLHHWSANILVAVVLAHLLRVFFTGGFHGPRQFNWVIGCGLLGLVLAANFTGYLLPWDQLAYWAVTICTGMLGYVPWIGGWLQAVARGGPDIGAATLVLFYAFHTTLLPVLLGLVTGFHFWRVRKAGGVVDPRPSDEPPETEPAHVSTLPELLLRELAAGLALIAVVCVLAATVDAPLGAAANPGMSPNPAKAPWYFVGFQELQLHFHPLFAVVVIPLGAVLALLAVPYLRYEPEMSGPWFLSAVGRRSAALAAAVGAAVTLALIIGDALLQQGEAGMPGLIGRGLLPAAGFLFAVAGFRRLLVARLGAVKAEVVQAIFVLCFAVWAMLTVVGVFLRGPGMALVWP
jgi:quinol-cytochrome oxidoreductase complex cytochrome b subunit